MAGSAAVPSAMRRLAALCLLAIGADAVGLQKLHSQNGPKVVSRATLLGRPEIYMLTFGHGRGFQNSQHRLSAEAKQTRLFDHIYNYSDFPDFIKKDKRWTKHMNISKGMGYWFWKAPLAKHLMNNVMRENDILVYVDSGSEFGNMSNFEEVARSLCNHDLVAFALKQKEKTFTKGDLFNYFGVTTDDRFYATSQLCATYFVMKNTAASRRFVDRWEHLAENLQLIGDAESKTENDPGFKEHRRDQSIFSMLVKANQPAIASDQESKFPAAANATRHPQQGVEGFRPFIMNDPGYPQDPAHKWISASRNHFGVRRFKNDPATNLSNVELGGIKQKFIDC